MRLPRLHAKRFLESRPGELLRLSLKLRQDAPEQHRLVLAALAPDGRKAAVLLGQATEPLLYVAPAEFERDAISFGTELRLEVPPDARPFFGAAQTGAPQGHLAVVGSRWFLHAVPLAEGADPMYLDLQSFELVKALPRNEVRIEFGEWSLRQLPEDTVLHSFRPGGARATRT